MAVLVRVVPQTSTRALQELEARLPSAVLARARSEDRGEKASAQQNRVLPQAVIGSGAGAGAGAAATLVRGTRKWNGRVCYGAQCAAGRGSPGGVVSLLAPASVTSYTRLRTGHAKWAQCTQGTQAGLRQVRGQGFIGASGSSFSRRGEADRVCAEPELLEQPGNGFTAHKLAAPWSRLHAYQARSEHCITTATTRRFRRFNSGEQRVVWARTAAGRVPAMGGGSGEPPWFCGLDSEEGERGNVRTKTEGRCVRAWGGAKNDRNST